MIFSTFFDDMVPGKWGILPYLNTCHQQSCQKKTRFDFSAAIDCYLESLRAIIASKPESIKADYAQALFNSYHEKGRSSDRARAHEWNRRHSDPRSGKAKKTAPRKRPHQKRRAGPKTIIYNNHGTMINGSVEGSSLIINPQPDASPSAQRTGDEQQNDSDEDGDEAYDGELEKEDEWEIEDEWEKDDEWEKEGEEAVTSTSTSAYLRRLSDKCRAGHHQTTPDEPDECTYEDSGEETLASAEFLTSLERTSRELKNKLKLPNGKYLEDVLIYYAKTLKNLDVAHWLMIDPTDRRLKTLLLSNGWKDEAEGQGFILPQLPEVLSEHISKYANVTDRTTCKSIAYSTDQEWNIPGCDSDQLFLKRWIDDASDHMISLMTESNGLLKQPLNEGAWEGIYYPILDKCFTNLGELMLQRDTMLLAHEHDPNPVLKYSVRYDGVLHTRDIFPQCGSRLEFAMIEVSREFAGYDSTKWNGDCTKLYAGCLAILRDLKKAVNYHPPTVAKLAAAAVLQAGHMTVVLVVSCLGPNLYYLRRGAPREVPCEVQKFDKLGDLLTVIWKARETVRRSYQAVKEYFNDVESRGRAVGRTDAGFL